MNHMVQFANHIGSHARTTHLIGLEGLPVWPRPGPCLHRNGTLLVAGDIPQTDAEPDSNNLENNFVKCCIHGKVYKTNLA